METRDELRAALSTILAGEQEADREYAGTSVREVFAMAAWFCSHFGDGEKRNVVCLAAQDRAVIAAALLASLAGGPVLLLPHAFSGQALADLQQATGVRVAISDRDRDFPAGMESVRPGRDKHGSRLSTLAVDPDRELLRLYTGGSTGTPKIWSKTAGNIFAESLFLAGHFRVTPADRIVATISPYHIYGLLYSVTLPLVSGARVLPETPSFPEEIIRAVDDFQASILISVPAHYRVLRDKQPLAASLRLAFSSAGPLEPQCNDDFTRSNGVGIVEVYGSTETGGIALRNRFKGEERFTPYPTIDWEVSGQRLLVRSSYLSPELPRNASGFYATGDRVEMGESSTFSLKGRADSITKVAGNRVDLEEITACIKEQKDVADCLVLAIEEGGGRQYRIVAVIEGEGVDIEALRKILAARFEPYALPRTIRKVTRMPMKENGKYDRDQILRLLEQ